jgi:hypothetical protein
LKVEGPKRAMFWKFLVYFVFRGRDVKDPGREPAEPQDYSSSF